jgi:sec-independent protein translocase protein TatA
MFVGALEPWHLILILAIVLLLFGPGKLPSLGKAVGDGIREFRRGSHIDEPAAPAAAATTAPALAQLRCSNCGIAAPAGSKFCGGCGTAFAAPAPPRVDQPVAH